MQLSTKTATSIVNVVFNAVKENDGSFLSIMKSREGAYSAKAFDHHSDAVAQNSQEPGSSSIVLPYDRSSVLEMLNEKEMSSWANSSLPSEIEIRLSASAIKNRFHIEEENDDEQ
jgi:hypothetical protein